MDTSKNTLLKFANLPAFEKITSKDMYQAISFLVQENKKIVKKIESLKKLTWKNFIYLMEESDDKIAKAWEKGLISCMN